MNPSNYAFATGLTGTIGSALLGVAFTHFKFPNVGRYFFYSALAGTPAVAAQLLGKDPKTVAYAGAAGYLGMGAYALKNHHQITGALLAGGGVVNLGFATGSFKRLGA